MKKILIILALFIVLLAGVSGGAVVDRLFGFRPLDKLFPRLGKAGTTQKIVLNEESVVINVTEKVSPSVVTVSVMTPKRTVLQFSPFGGFSQSIEGGENQDIGTGFILTSDGLIVTNKHVVANGEAKYKVITKDGKEFEAKEISRDPSNDIAIIKIDAKDLNPINLGDSSNLKVGQFVIAIGTALGEFRNTVTTGVVSGLGRGITAGSSFEGYVERLDNVIQTDAAINPGNSGGPLLNSSGEVIGINVAVAQGAQNIGFAIPVNVVKDALNTFKATGKFPAKPYLGIRYQAIPQRTALLNNVPQGMYVVEVVPGSPAETAGIQVDDIITKIDDTAMTENTPLSDVISKKKSGDKVKVEIWRGGETKTVEVTLTDAQG
jgi:serine protease Do